MNSDQEKTVHEKAQWITPLGFKCISPFPVYFPLKRWIGSEKGN